MGAHHHYRAPMLDPVTRETIWCLVLLAPTAGLLAAAIQDTYHSPDPGWVALLAVLLVEVLLLYGWVVRDWVRLIGPGKEYVGVEWEYDPRMGETNTPEVW